MDDVLGDQVVEFMTRHRNDPFFIAFWPYNVHAPFQADPEVIQQFRERADRADFQQSAIMAAMVKTLDDNVGKVMAALDELGLTDNTILIFPSIPPVSKAWKTPLIHFQGLGKIAQNLPTFGNHRCVDFQGLEQANDACKVAK